MEERCELLTTEYRHKFERKKLDPVQKILQRDYFSERIEEGQLDSSTASIPQKLDEAAENIVQKRMRDLKRSVYQVHYKNPWQLSSDDSSEMDTEDFGSALLTYIQNLYFNPHKELVLSPPPTSKRVYGYPHLKLLHASLSTYQDSFGRVAGDRMLKQANALSGVEERKNPD